MKSGEYDTSLFIFRRDLRLSDNTGLINALETSREVIPLFILDKRIVGKNNINANIIQFLVESLSDLDNQLKQNVTRLNIIYDEPEKAIRNLFSQHDIEAIYFNRDYTPYSQKRDQRIAEISIKQGIDLHISNDYLMNEPEAVFTTKNDPYTVFTPYYNKALQIRIKYPKKNDHKNYFQGDINCKNKIENVELYIKEKNPNLTVHGGINNCSTILDNLSQYSNYEFERDYPALNKTTHLSAYLKFGICSVREVYHKIRAQLGEDHPLIRQLYWRDFFTQIGYYFPRVFSNSFRVKYDEIKWEEDTKKFQTWCDGKTGFPIVDAGMRELNTTGYMHNRVRMIVASFLTKDLHVDWRKGEQYFAKNLVDFDISVNNGNWQWAASTGCDAQPYFRIFNPWTQQKKFDAECKYIKKWIPELAEVENKVIHNWFKTNNFDEIDYPKPIIDHKIESKKSKEIYVAVSKEYR